MRRAAAPAPPWAALGPHLVPPPRRLLQGKIFAEWFKGGRTNIAYNCLDRHVKEGHGAQPCFLFEGNDPGREGVMTYEEVLKVRPAGQPAGAGLPRLRSDGVLRRGKARSPGAPGRQRSPFGARAPLAGVPWPGLRCRLMHWGPAPRAQQLKRLACAHPTPFPPGLMSPRRRSAAWPTGCGLWA